MRMLCKLTANVFGLGEVAEPKSQIEKLNFKIKTNVNRRTEQPFCQTRVISWLDCLAQMPNRSTKEKIKIKKSVGKYV